MGQSAARILLQRIQGFKDYPKECAVPPELIIRESTLPQVVVRANHPIPG